MTLKSTPQVAAASFAREIGVEVNFSSKPNLIAADKKIILPFFDHTDPKQLNAAWGLVANLGGHLRYETEASLTGLAALLYQPISNGFVERKMINTYPGLHGIFNSLGNDFIEKGVVSSITELEPPVSMIAMYTKLYVANLLGYSSYSEPLSASTQLFESVFGKDIQSLLQAGLIEAVNCSTQEQMLESTKLLARQLEDLLGNDQNDDQGTAEQSKNDDNQVSNNADSMEHGQGDSCSDSVTQMPLSLKQDGDVSQDESISSGDTKLSEEQLDDLLDNNQNDDQGTTEQSNNAPTSTTNSQDNSLANGNSSDETALVDSQGAVSSDNDTISDENIEALQMAIEEASDAAGKEKSVSESMRDLIVPTQNPEPALCEVCIKTHDEQGGSELNPSALAASAYMAQSLEAILSSITKCKPYSARSGRRLDRRIGQRLAMGDSRVFIREEEGLFPNTAINLLLDLSGSMKSREKDAKTAVLALSFACESISQIDVEVMSFKEGQVDQLKPFERSTYQSKCFDVVEAAGGTPLQKGISAAATSLMSMPAERHAIWVITDGEAKDSSRELVKLLKQEGVLVMGIFIGAMKSKYKTHMKKVFGDDWFQAKNVKDLQPKLFDLANDLVEPYL